MEYSRAASRARPVIYELVVRTFGNTNVARHLNGTLEENGVGKLAHINDAALQSLADLGITHVWLAGLLRQATLTAYPALDLPADQPDVVKGRAGSFYAVRDCFDVCPDYALDPRRRLQELRALVDRIHAAGMRVLVDLVPNHTSRSYHSVVRPELDFGRNDDQSKFFSPRNNYFYLVNPPGQRLSLAHPKSWAPAGVEFNGGFPLEEGGRGRVPRATGNNVTSPRPSLFDWYDTVKLNYGFNFVTGEACYDPIPATWKIMDEVIACWQSRGIDGFRCDFANLVPRQAWHYLITRAKARAEVTFVAEAYSDLGGMLEAGFDAVYHDAAYDALKRIYQGTGDQQALSGLLRSLREVEQSRYLHYLENHDERRIASPIVRSGCPEDSGFGCMDAAHQLAPILYLCSAGPLLLFNGQEVGEPASGAEGFSGDDGRTSIFDYTAMPELARFVNGHRYDGGLLGPEQRALRAYYADLLALCQEEPALGTRYFGLKEYNSESRFPDCPAALFSFARFATGAGKVLVVAASFAAGGPVGGRLRLPAEVAAAAGLSVQVRVFLRLDERGAHREELSCMSRAALSDEGWMVEVANQSAAVFEIR